ncbi:META domain-containing protein [Dyadobacter psychrophilus]|uniref:META domain-containing protein n=1 Tax=Dyadobacter psychrophilus TaxID=651661 RepID=A0A1T5GYI5_9BACT|nr:META domain-containing protein [Dyadobacter psychrophilus]SKC13441.1 META domain-containing protein [Dyadobacter psychrophilus]
MKKIIPQLTFLFGIFAMFSCGKTTTISSNMELTGKWELQSIVQNSDTIQKPALAKGQMPISLNFKEKGELEGTTSTNILTGFYETAQQNTIQMGGGGTERAETQWGNLFVNALPNVNLYDLKMNRLVLYYENNNQMIFSRVQ